MNKYLLAGKSMPWYAMVLSIMATQASAITFISTTGQSYTDGMRFVQFYFGLPVAMVILSATAVPIFHRARVYTAYEYLEKRFDAKTRALVSGIFLIQRGLAAGLSLYAPAVVLSVILGWPDRLTTVLMGALVVTYTSLGGIKAVTWADVQQMMLILCGLVMALVMAVHLLPGHVSFGSAVTLAGAAGKLNAVNFHFDWNDRYNVWSGMIGGMFLMLAYFGCDQSQVQRYLTAKSVDEARQSLLMSAFVKIPLPPMLFNRTYDAQVHAGSHAAEYNALEADFDQAIDVRRDAAERNDRAAFLAGEQRVRDIRDRATAIVKDTTGDQRYSDVNYVFPTFITTELPTGLVGLMIAAIFAAAMSASGGELNALATATVIDFYRRHFVKEATDAHYLTVSKLATIAWGLFACIVAMFSANQGSLIEVVNRYGSFFYGSLLGVFMLAILTRRATARGAFWGLIAGMVVVLTVAIELPWVAFLWHNLIGAVVVVV